MSFYNNSELHALNHTELYQRCRAIGIKVHPRSTREELITYLLGEAETLIYDDASHPLDSLRRGIISFLEDYWATLAPQVKCPAKMLRHPITPNPKPCFGCVDTQVIACIVKNTKNERAIIERRPTRGKQ